MVRELALELEGWQISHRLSTKTFQYLVANQEKIVEDMKEAQKLLNPIPRVPPDIWIDIFGKCIQLEMEEYVSGESTTPLRYCAFILSQVCRGWRSTLLQERNLWDVIAIHPYKSWSQDKYNFFTTLLSRSSPRVTLVANASQRLGWAYEHDGHDRWIYTNNQGLCIDGINPNGKSEVVEKSYTIHIIASNGVDDSISRISDIPFIQPSSLEVTLLQPTVVGTMGIFKRLLAFRFITSLTLNQECPLRYPWPNYFDGFSNLKTVKLHVQEFSFRFPIREFLVPGLKEFHLHYKSNDKPPRLPDHAQLPNLETLGISFPGSEFLSILEAPLLSTLLFYGPVEPATMSLATDDDKTNTAIITLLKRITHIQFEDWTASPGGAEAASCFHELWTKMPRLERLTFSDSYVNGETLISTIDPSRLPADDQLSFSSSLASITLSHTTGITQAQCEELRSLGKTVHIYA